MSKRIIQINELIRSHLGEIFSHEINLKPGVLVTITKVDTTPDLRRSDVLVSVFPESEERYAMKTIGNEKRSIQKALHEKLYMKPLPKLTFSFDPTESKADEIERILKGLEKGEI